MPESGTRPGTSAPQGCVVIPAHDEAAVLPRLLDQLAEAAADGSIEVVVVPNGCRDATADVARRYPGVIVAEVPVGSKIAALNRGDDVATAFPRAYLDADVEVTAAALRAVFRALDAPGGPLAARPRSRYETTRATPAVRAYYRAKVAAVGADPPHLWGAGCYVLSRAARETFGRWPDVQGDDYWIDGQFEPAAKAIIEVPPVVVRPPRSLRDVVRTGARHYRGNAAVDQAAPANPSSTARTATRLARSVRGPRAAADAAVYAAATIAARLLARWPARAATWERDATTR